MFWNRNKIIDICMYESHLFSPVSIITNNWSYIGEYSIPRNRFSATGLNSIDTKLSDNFPDVGEEA